MRIQSSDIAMSASSSIYQSYTKEESLKVWIGNERPDFEGKNSLSGQASNNILDSAEISEFGRFLQSHDKVSSAPVEEEPVLRYELSDEDERKLEMIRQMLQTLTGKRVRFFIPEKINLKLEKQPIDMPALNQREAPPPQKRGWGMEYDLHESYQEREKMSFNAEGVVKTADGKEIKFSLQLNMSREFASSQNISIRAGDAKLKDPLVINFAGSAPELTDTKYSFDIDMDGSPENIPFLTQGSGFLALDSNNDGVINDGSELFGPSSGNGFSELANYDADHNNWIDENDPIYDKLRIWTKDAQGNDKLFALGQKGIGAIYLGNVDTAFSLKNETNDLLGQVQKTGIFLKENGVAGTIQHIDLSI